MSTPVDPADLIGITLSQLLKANLLAKLCQTEHDGHDGLGRGARHQELTCLLFLSCSPPIVRASLCDVGKLYILCHATMESGVHMVFDFPKSDKDAVIAVLAHDLLAYLAWE